MEKIALYVRVSTDIQVREGFSLEAQTKEGIRRAKREGWKYEVFTEAGRSADKEDLKNRPVLQKLLDEVDDGKFQYVFVTEIDRLSRNPALLNFIKKILHDNNVKIVTLSQTFNLEDDEDDFMSDLLGLLAKRENRVRAKRSKRGKLECALKGRWPGGPSPFGFQLVDGELRPHPENIKYYNMMVQMSLEGKGTGIIARELERLGVPSRDTAANKKGNKHTWHGEVVRRILINPLYKGEFHYKGHIVENKHHLIEKDTWELISKNLEKNRIYSRGNTKRFYLLRKLLYCAKCGRRLYGLIKPSRGMRLYSCLSKRPDPTPRFCGLKNVNLDYVNNYVKEKILKMIKDPKELEKALKVKQDDVWSKQELSKLQLEKIKKDIEQTEGQIDSILELYTKSKELKGITIADLDRKTLKLKERKEKLLTELKDAESWIEMSKHVNTALEACKEILIGQKGKIAKYSDKEWYVILHKLVTRITVDYDEVTGEHSLKIEGNFGNLEEHNLQEDKQMKPVQSQHEHRCSADWRGQLPAPRPNQPGPSRGVVFG
ncbi:recombinase family protein [Candidatus Omnitrophota bacterium]